MAKEEQSTRTGAVTVAASVNVPFDLSSFSLESCTLEIRYPFALSLWDNAGQLWKAVQERWPSIVPIHAEPKKTEFQHGNSRLVVEFEQARITAVDPEKSLDQFLKDSKEFMRITTQHLQLSIYKRVGFRLMYFKEFKDKKEAANAFFSLGLIRLPEGRKFEIDEQPANPQYGLRWESEKRGVMLNCRTETRVVNVEPSPEAARVMEPIHKETSGMVLDIDYYTAAPVETGQLDTSEWMKHAMHLISRDSRYLFGD